MPREGNVNVPIYSAADHIIDFLFLRVCRRKQPRQQPSGGLRLERGVRELRTKTYTRDLAAFRNLRINETLRKLL